MNINYTTILVNNLEFKTLKAFLTIDLSNLLSEFKSLF